jgi:hypothetical protein
MADMTRKEAARELDNTACCFSDKRFRDAMHMAADSLRGWVKTADRLPTEADAGYGNDVVAIYRKGKTESLGCNSWVFVASYPQFFPYWLPLPKLPEVEE